MKSASAKQPSRSKTAPASKPRQRAVKTVMAAMDEPLAAVANAVVGNISCDATETVVATTWVAVNTVMDPVPAATLSKSSSCDSTPMATPIDDAIRVDDVASAANDIVILPAHCAIRDVAELKLRLLPCVNAVSPVFIDVQYVERIDTATLQALLAFVRDRRSQQHTTTWVGLNEVFIDSARLLGLDQMLGLPASETAV